MSTPPYFFQTLQPLMAHQITVEPETFSRRLTHPDYQALDGKQRRDLGLRVHHLAWQMSSDLWAVTGAKISPNCILRASRSWLPLTCIAIIMLVYTNDPQSRSAQPVGHQRLCGKHRAHPAPNTELSSTHPALSSCPQP